MTERKANGLRRSPFTVLTDADIAYIKKEIRLIEADEKVFVFNEGVCTSYTDSIDSIDVMGDIFPDEDSTHPRDTMSVRAVLAHEYYGHRANKGTILPQGSWADEFRASYMAAQNTPNLTDTDVRHLILDALERAKEAGVAIRYNAFIRRILHGG